MKVIGTPNARFVGRELGVAPTLDPDDKFVFCVNGFGSRPCAP